MFRATAKTTLLLAASLFCFPIFSAAQTPPPTAFPEAPVANDLASFKATTKPSTRPAVTYKTIRGAKGYWRLAQTTEGVWWFLSPDGKREFLNTVTTVQPWQSAREGGVGEFLSTDYNAPVGDDNGDNDAWAKKTAVRIRAAGFKGLGAWCNVAFHNTDLPMTRDLNILAYMSGHGLKFYSAEWPAIADKAVKARVEPLKENHHLVGYFTDNELDWGDNTMGPGVYFDNLPADDPNRREVNKVIQKVWTDIAIFNADWKTSLGDWAELDAWKTLPRGIGDSYARLFTAWLSHLSEDYFRFTTQLIRKYDPHHLILGVRFKATAPVEVVRASKKYIDAHSINVYPADAKLDRPQFARLYEESGLPVIISEYSFHSLDGRSGNRNTFGFGAQVLDQQARADAYRLFTTRLARVPYIIGADWFQWMDEPPSGRTGDGEDVNFGVVDIDDKPYELLVDSIKKTTPLLNPLHEASHRDSQSEVWRAQRPLPTFKVPFLEKAPRLNGELSDWPAEAKLTEVRIADTIGLERHKLPLPNVYLGWNYEGLYLGMEVFDNDVHAGHPKGAWWTRDVAELFVSTRTVPSDLEIYNEFCHQFFFVPLTEPFEGHYLGVVGQWHRQGDALENHLVPHPLIKEGVRTRTDRYVVEMFIPAKAMNGFDPKNSRDLAFNLNIRNYQHATDYYWSAPKDVNTQVRPSTWGTLQLADPPSSSLVATPTTQPAIAGSSQ